MQDFVHQPYYSTRSRAPSRLLPTRTLKQHFDSKQCLGNKILTPQDPDAFIGKKNEENGTSEKEE